MWKTIIKIGLSLFGSEISEELDDALDLDGDGVDDAIAMDTDGDGYVDTVAMDTDEDGRYRLYYIISNFRKIKFN